MARHKRLPFQLDKPVFVKVPLRERGRLWPVGQVFKWKEMRMDQDKIMRMYNQGFLYHDEDKEEELFASKTVGDGLNDLDIESLHKLVEDINKVVADKVKNAGEFQKKKCPISKIKDKQVGLIRRWRMTYGNLE
jgi:hypothetical protein